MLCYLILRYKSLQEELADERSSVFEVVDKGKQILHSVSCPSLETAITDLAEKWVSLNTDLTHELKRFVMIQLFTQCLSFMCCWFSYYLQRLAVLAGCITPRFDYLFDSRVLLHRFLSGFYVFKMILHCFGVSKQIFEICF